MNTENGKNKKLQEKLMGMVKDLRELAEGDEEAVYGWILEKAANNIEWANERIKSGKYGKNKGE